MPTLKELMGDKTRGDGRKFARKSWPTNAWFEPIFLSATNCWHGIKGDANADLFPDSCDGWEEWPPPKQTKKVKLYRPIYKTETNEYVVDGWWRSYKAENSDRGKAVGWQEMEVEVTE